MARSGRARCGEAGLVWQGVLRSGGDWHGPVGQVWVGGAWCGEAGRGKAGKAGWGGLRRGVTRFGWARFGKAGRGRFGQARRGVVWWVEVGLGMAGMVIFIN